MVVITWGISFKTALYLPVKAGYWGEFLSANQIRRVDISTGWHLLEHFPPWGGHSVAVSVRASQFPGGNLLGFGEQLLKIFWVWKMGALGLYKQFLGIPDSVSD